MTSPTYAQQCAATCKEPTLEQIAWSEYDNAAEDLARRGLNGNAGDPLPVNMTLRAVQLIAEDVEAFQERVRLSAYMLAMNGLHAKN